MLELDLVLTLLKKGGKETIGMFEIFYVQRAVKRSRPFV